MAITVILQACTLLSLCCMAWGTLDLPTFVQVHAGQKTHILCIYTCQEADSCDVRLDWKDRPPEFRSFKRCYNGSHHSLRMNIEAGSQEVKTSQIITCVAMSTEGTILEEGSTYLEICPTETLECRFPEEALQTSPTVHICACQYQSDCATLLKCKSYKERSPRYLGYNDTGSWKVEVYEFIALKPGDIVTCRLDSHSIEEHLQTTVELALPEESSPEQTTQTSTTQALTNPAKTTQAQMNQAPTTQAPDAETQTNPTLEETSTKPPPNQCPVNSCNCAQPWVLFGLTMIVLIAVCVGIVCKKKCKTNQARTLTFLPHRYVCKDTD